MTLRSNAAIAGLVPLATVPENVDILVELCGAADPAAAEAGGPTLEYEDARFTISEDRITCTYTSTPEDAATYLLGPVLAHVLRRRGTLALHASGIVIRDHAVLIAGAPGSGKSTVAAACALRGATVMTDDVAAIEWREDRAFVLPGYPRLRLWSDVAESLWGSADALPLLTPTWNKRFVDLTAGEYVFAAEAKPAGAICVLAGRAPQPSLREVRGHEAAITLLRHASVTWTLDDSLREGELAEVARLASTVPVFELTAPDDLRRASELCDLLP